MNDLSEKDLEALLNFLNSYELKPILENEGLIFTVKRIHRVYFGLITFMGEFEMISNSDNHSNKLAINNLKYLREVCSDLGHAFFCNVQGTYKGAGMLLRSSLEGLWKVVISSKEKVIFGRRDHGHKLKERAKKAYLRDIFIKQILDEMYENHYSPLSEIVHTTHTKQMEQTSALNYFPKFAESHSQKVETHFVKLCQYYTLICCLIYREFFLQMHPANQRIVLNGIAPNYRSIVLGDAVSKENHIKSSYRNVTGQSKRRRRNN